MLLSLCLLVPVNGEKLSYVIDTLAGSSRLGDGGPAAAAWLRDVQGVAVDQIGNLYVADSSDHRVRKISTNGTISTVAGNGLPGYGGDGGPGAAAQLNAPYGLAADGSGVLYIADLGNNRIRKLAPDGVISTVAPAAQWLSPRNVAVDGTGNLYVAEFDGHRVRKIAPDGLITTVAGRGTAGLSGDGGLAAAAQLAFPAGLAVDSAGALYIADSSNGRVRKVVGATITTLQDGLGLPTGLAFDRDGNLFIAESGNHRVQQLAATGQVSTAMNAGSSDVRDVAIDAAGRIYIASGRSILSVKSGGTANVIAGDTSSGDTGPAGTAHLNAPAGIAIDNVGNLYIADQANNRIRKVSAAGVISTVAGTADQLSSPAAVAVDAAGDIYIADKNHHRIVQLINSGVFIPIAGQGIAGFSGDDLPGTVALLASPSGVALDALGNLYIADTGNHRIRKLTGAGIISTVAGTGSRGFAGDDGQAAAAQLDTPRGVATDNAGNIYIADTGNHRIRKINTAGAISTIAGNGAAGFSGDGGSAAAAQLNMPRSVALDLSGVMYIADSGNNRVRVVTPAGQIDTIAGTGAAGLSGDGGPAAAAELNLPSGIALDKLGQVLIADTGNNRIRILTRRAAPPQVAPLETISVTNGATMLAGPVAPGEIVSIFGSGIGPSIAVGAKWKQPGVLDTSLADTQVLFDDHPAALFYVQDAQINAQVPYEIAGHESTQVQVVYKGVATSKVTVGVMNAAPGIFTLASGKGQAVVLNEDGTLNSTTNPAPRDSVVTLFATGEGQITPAGIDGKISSAPFPKPVLPVALQFADYGAEILFAGEAPGFCGLLQINARVPGGFAPTGVMPVVLTVGNVFSQPGVTVAVR